jgi:DnaK suppressor protein
LPKASAAKKTRKSAKSGFAALKASLETQRQEILDMYEHDLKVGQEMSDEGAEDLVDRANSAYNREFMLSLSGSELEILKEIEEALERIDSGAYGVCAACQEKIAHKRLQAVPWARYCIDCQELAEQGLLPDA